MDSSDAEIIQAVRAGQPAAFESIITKYQPRVFAMARRYARRESEVEDIVQEVFVKAFHKLSSYRSEAPFEHWLMRLAVRTCYDFLRVHQRSREFALGDVAPKETDWIAATTFDPTKDRQAAAAAKALVEHLLEQLSPSARLVITLLEIEEKSVKEISKLTGWSIPLVKVRAFRARLQMKKILRTTRLEEFL